MPAPLPDLVLYGRPGCHLCDETRANLATLFDARRAAALPVPAIRVVDITTDPALLTAFATSIPVVELGDRRLELAVSTGRLRRLLEQVLDTAAPVSTSSDQR